MKTLELGVAGDRCLTAQAVQEMTAPLLQIDDPRRHPARVQGDPQGIGRRLEQVRVDPVGQQPDRVVARQQVVVAIDHNRRVWLVRPQEPLERLAHRCHLGRLEAPLAVQGRETGGQQQAVALAQGNLEVLGEVKHHLTARPGAPGLQKADVP